MGLFTPFGPGKFVPLENPFYDSIGGLAPVNRVTTNRVFLSRPWSCIILITGEFAMRRVSRKSELISKPFLGGSL